MQNRIQHLTTPMRELSALLMYYALFYLQSSEAINYIKSIYVCRNTVFPDGLFCVSRVCIELRGIWLKFLVATVNSICYPKTVQYNSDKHLDKCLFNLLLVLYI